MPAVPGSEDIAVSVQTLLAELGVPRSAVQSGPLEVRSPITGETDRPRHAGERA